MVTTPAGTGAGGCLTTKKRVHREGLFSRNGGLFLLTFFTFCYFLLLFLLLITFISYFFTTETGVRFFTFLLFVTFINYFLLLRRAKVYRVFIVQGGELKNVQVDFFPSIFFYCQGGGGWRSTFFFP
jgi:hypothetical protein